MLGLLNAVLPVHVLELLLEMSHVTVISFVSIMVTVALMLMPHAMVSTTSYASTYMYINMLWVFLLFHHMVSF